MPRKFNSRINFLQIVRKNINNQELNLWCSPIESTELGNAHHMQLIIGLYGFDDTHRDKWQNDWKSYV